MGKHILYKGENPQGNLPEEFVAGDLVGAQIIAQQAGIIVRHLLEVRNNPALVHRVAVEAAADLVVNTAPSHALERRRDDRQQPLLAGFEVRVEQQVERAGVRELGRGAESAILRIEPAADALHNGLHDLFVGLARALFKAFQVTQSFSNLCRALVNLLAVGLVVVRHSFQQALHARAAGVVFGREISAAIERFTVGSKKRRQRPTSLPRQRTDRRLVTRVDIRALVAIDFHGDEQVVDEARHLRVLVTFVVHHVAPVAPDSADIQQDGLVLLARLREGCLAPLAPFDGLVRGGAQIGAGCLRQFVVGFFRVHGGSRIRV